jgi:hypothetical protein
MIKTITIEARCIAEGDSRLVRRDIELVGGEREITVKQFAKMLDDFLGGFADVSNPGTSDE